MKIMTRGEDAEFFARLVRANGGRVVHIERLLYVAQFRHDSLLFSDGLVEHLADGRVRFDRRPDNQ
jgi:hypothetical protein